MILEIEGKRVEVDDSFRSLSPEEQQRTVEEIASQIGIAAQGQEQQEQSRHPMAGFNEGLARGADALAGGASRLVNAGIRAGAGALGVEDPFQFSTEPMRTVMDATGVPTLDGERPDGLVGEFAVGAGEAASMLAPVGAGLNLLSRVGGRVAGPVAGQAYNALASVPGVAAEAVAGGVSGSAQRAAEDAGAPEWAQQVAGIGAPVAAVGAGVGAYRAARGIGQYTPLGTAVRSATAALAPYTRSGAREVARRRFEDLAGGRERAHELADRIGGENPLNLTPAQQTGDPNMLALEQTAMSQDAALRSRIEGRLRASTEVAREDIASMGGDPEAAQRFFQTRREAFARDLKAIADETLTEARQRAVTTAREPGENSLIVSQELNRARDAAKMHERELWEAIPRDAQVGTGNLRSVVTTTSETIPFAQRNDIPVELREVIDNPEVYGDLATVNDMHGLYSRLRETARAARAGNAPQPNKARIADQAAEAILRDLGAVDGTTPLGRQINEARAFSRAFHETFDQGAVGRLSRRTLEGDTAVDPELALQRTVGRGGTEGAVAARQIETAGEGLINPTTGEVTYSDGGRTRNAAEDYLAGRFSEVVSGSGEFSTRSAHRFMNSNRELLARYPELRREIESIVGQNVSAERFAARVSERLGALMDARRSAGAAFLGGPPDQAVQRILGARNPALSARRLANEARKDPTGEALAGLKGAFTDHLISAATRVGGGEARLSGDAMLSAMGDRRMQAVLRSVFSESEMRRLQTLQRELSRVDTARQAAPGIGDSLSGAEAPKAIQYLARVIAARHGAQLGGGMAGGLQAAQMASSRAREIVQRLTADRASLIIKDAIEDPALFRALLTDLGSPAGQRRVERSLAPYLAGGAAATLTEE